MISLQWTTEKRKIDQLVGHTNNPRKISDQQMRQLRGSIEKFNFVEIPAIDIDNTILAGHQRLKAMQFMGRGEEEIDVRVPNRALTKEERDEYLNRSNKNQGEFDHDLLADFGKDLLADVGFESNELDRIFRQDEHDDGFDVEKEAEKIITPTAKLGDMYQLGRHRLLCGDCVKEEDVAKLMGGVFADMVFTDPPYNVDYEGGTGEKLKIENDNKSSEDFYAFLLQSFKNMFAVLKNGGGIYVCHADIEGINFRKSFIDSGFKLSSVIIWNKSSLVMGRADYHWKHEPILYGWKEGEAHRFYGSRDQSTVWDIEKPSRSREHPTMKPLQLVSKAVRNSSKRGEVVLDLFGGSGSTLIACEELNRNCYTMELDPRFVDVIIKRWETLTKEKSIKL